MSSLFAGLIVTLMLSFATPLIYYTPLCVLGAIVASAALAILDYHDIKFLWSIGEKVDLIKYVLTCLATMVTYPFPPP
jgi:MFS superfamily sulfate permease-like transporter